MLKSRIFGVITAAAMVSLAACAAEEEPVVEEPVVAPIAEPAPVVVEPAPVVDPAAAPVVDPAAAGTMAPGAAAPGMDTMNMGTAPATTTP